MSSVNYSNSRAGILSPILLHVCEDITRPDGTIHFVPAIQSSTLSPFPLLLSKITESNQPKDGDDNHYGGVLNYTKQQVLGAGVCAASLNNIFAIYSTFTRGHIHTHTHTHTHKNIHTYIHTYTHTYIHARTHARTHGRTNGRTERPDLGQLYPQYYRTYITETDIMGNAFLGLHGYPQRPEPTLAEIRAAIPPLRAINGARVWTANRESGRDASFDAQASNNVAGSPSPFLVHRVLPGASSFAFDREGILTGPGTQPLPILVLGFPVSSNKGKNLTTMRRTELAEQLEVAVQMADYSTASQLQRELGEFSPPACVTDTDCCYGRDIPSPGKSHQAATVDACQGLCEASTECVAWVFVQSSGECYLKNSFAPSQGHKATWHSSGHCYANRTSPRPSGGEMVFYEMAVTPVATGTGYEQPVFFRFLQVNASAAKGVSAPGTLYFDTFAYVPSKCDGTSRGSETMAGCDASSHFFSAVLDNYFAWNNTWQTEGVMTLNLPPCTDTDGVLLTRQAVHALVLDMITRHGDEAWPRYGTLPGYDQPGIGADGFQEIFTATMAAALEWGLHGYARTVLNNWLTYFIRDDGSVLYRGLEMAQQGRMLTMIAMYYSYTQDAQLLLGHLDRVEGIAQLLLKRREQAQALYNRSDPRYGMPTGNDEADLFWTTETGKPGTELPFLVGYNFAGMTVRC